MRKGWPTALALVALIVFPACTERRQLAMLQQAEEKLSQNRYAEAGEIFRKTIQLNPESKTAIKAIYKLGFVLETYLKDFDGAVFNYQEFTRMSQDPVSIYEVQKRIANIHFEQARDPEKIIAAYKKLVNMNPDSLEVDFFQFRIAQAYFRQNNFEQARLEYQQLLEKFPKSQFNARARFEIGNSYYMDGKYDVAVEALKQVIRHHPQSEYATEAQFLMAQCLEHQGRLQNAFQIYESVKGRYPAAEILNLRLNDLRKRLKTEH